MSLAGNRPEGLTAYVAVTAAYWAFMLTDGALRMLVLLHFHTLGFSPVQLAYLFVLYEIAGMVTNLSAGWIAARFGLDLEVKVGHALDIGDHHADRHGPARGHAPDRPLADRRAFLPGRQSADRRSAGRCDPRYAHRPRLGGGRQRDRLRQGECPSTGSGSCASTKLSAGSGLVLRFHDLAALVASAMRADLVRRLRLKARGTQALAGGL